MKILLLIAVVQALNLVVFAWFNRTGSVEDPGASSATRRLQAPIQQTVANKQGSTLLLLAVKTWKHWKSELILVSL